MSLDAQDWVWEHSQAKGTARLVLLAIADKASGKDCSAYAGSTFLMRRANASKSAIKAALDSLRESGELRAVPGRKGPLGETRYRLPKAVGHTRAASDKDTFGGGVDSDPPGQNQEPLGGTAFIPQGGTESDPGGIGFKPQGGTESDPQNAVHAIHAVEQLSPAAHEDLRSEDTRALANALHHAGLVGLDWGISSFDAIKIEALIKAKGIPAMVQRAVNVAAHARSPIGHVRYFLGKPGGPPGPWMDLPTITAPGAERPQLKAVSGGYQSYQQPSEDAFANQGGF